MPEVTVALVARDARRARARHVSAPRSLGAVKGDGVPPGKTLGRSLGEGRESLTQWEQIRCAQRKVRCGMARRQREIFWRRRAIRRRVRIGVRRRVRNGVRIGVRIATGHEEEGRFTLHRGPVCGHEDGFLLCGTFRTGA